MNTFKNFNEFQQDNEAFKNEINDFYQYLLEHYSDQIDPKLDSILESALKDFDINDPSILEEGLFSGLLGGGAAAAVGPKVMDIVCKALGITSGPLYDLFHSRLVLAAVGYQLAH